MVEDLPMTIRLIPYLTINSLYIRREPVTNHGNTITVNLINHRIYVLKAIEEQNKALGGAGRDVIKGGRGGVG